MKWCAFCQPLRSVFHFKWKKAGLLVFFACFTAIGTLQGQNMKLNGEAIPIPELFKEIKRQTGLVTTFDPAELKELPSLKLPAGNYPLSTILQKALQPYGFIYSISSKTIFVAKPSQKTLPSEKNGNDNIQVRDSVEGRVTDSLGKPMEGVSVSLKGISRGAFTDKEGRYVLHNINIPNSVLVFSFVGYRTEKVPLKDRTPTKIIMHIEEVNLGIKEIVVSGGYYTVKDREKTGSIARITSKEIESQPVSNPLAAMIGRVPGIDIIQNSGVPGSTFSVQIRGRNSLAQRSEPLFIIDGVPFAPGNTNIAIQSSVANGLSPFSSINPADIESIEILKDADATSIYGSRGANGVVLITTKKGKSGLTRLNIRHSQGLSDVAKKIKMLGTKEYLELRREAFKNDDIVPSTFPGNTGYAPDIMLWDTTRYTNLNDLMMGGTAQTINTSLNVSGGSDKTQFMLGGSLNQESTIFVGDSRYQKGSVNFNINHRALHNKLNLAFGVNYSLESNNLFSSNALFYSNLPPNLPELYDSNGKLNWAENGASFSNPIAFTQKDYNSYRKNLISRLQLSYSILDNLTLKTALGYNDIHADEKSFNPLSTQDPQAEGYDGFAQYSSNSFSSWIIEPQADYRLKSGIGEFNLIAGGTLQQTLNEASSIRASGYTDDKLLRSLAAATTISDPYSLYSLYKYAALFARINYNLDGKYLLNISGRRDGSSRFGTANRWGIFYSTGAAWIFSKEKFFSENLSFITFGKLRTSYGTSGNDQIGDYQYLDTWSTWRPYQGTISLYPGTLYNPNYGWEINKKYEIALETGWFNDRILFNMAFFSNRSDNQLIQYILPSQTGHFSINRNFPALIQNSGWESELGIKIIDKKSLKWETRWNITIPKNRLLQFENLENSAYHSKYVLGESLNLIYGYQSLGVNPKTGVYEFQDSNGDGTLNSKDFVVSGNLDPKFYGGWSNTLQFKGLSITTFFQFKKQKGTTILNSLYSAPQSFPGMMFNQPLMVLDRWKKPGDLTNIQKASTSTSSDAYLAANNYIRESDAVVGDASFIRLKTLEVSYSLPQVLIKKISAQSCNVFLQGQNLWTITNYNGWDPETQGNPFAIPPLRSFNFGFIMSF